MWQILLPPPSALMLSLTRVTGSVRILSQEHAGEEEHRWSPVPHMICLTPCACMGGIIVVTCQQATTVINLYFPNTVGQIWFYLFSHTEQYHSLLASSWQRTETQQHCLYVICWRVALTKFLTVLLSECPHFQTCSLYWKKTNRWLMRLIALYIE